MKILTAEQLREIDRLSTAQYGIPGILLMENAGMRVVEELEALFDDLEDKTIGILCGKGNNGGDGFVIARQLVQKGCYPFVFLFADESEVQGDARTNLEILKAIGCPPTVVTEIPDWAEERLEILDADILIDALLGTGLAKPVSGLYKAVIESLADFSNATIVPVDLPSGLQADSARIPGSAVEADITVTFTALKPCLVLPPAQKMAGDVVVSEIGNPFELLESPEFQLDLIEPAGFASAVRPRLTESNKGDFGRVLVIGGSRGKSGAAVMAGQAALRSGAGLVTVAVPESLLPIVASAMPELMTEPLAETTAGTLARQELSRLLHDKSIVAIGPGLTSQDETAELVRELVRGASQDLVVDADGLNAFVGHAEALRGNGHAIILTPHPGEMSRLIGRDTAYVQENRIEVARDFVVAHKVYLVLKGFRTIVATPDGSVHINATGNPGMATGGTGDILTGMIAGILAQENLGNFVERLCLAVYLHGAAGDLAAEELGEEVLTATDILRFLPQAWKALRGVEAEV